MQFNEILDKLTRLEPKRCEYRQVGSQQYIALWISGWVYVKPEPVIYADQMALIQYVVSRCLRRELSIKFLLHISGCYTVWLGEKLFDQLSADSIATALGTAYVQYLESLAKEKAVATLKQ